MGNLKYEGYVPDLYPVFYFPGPSKCCQPNAVAEGLIGLNSPGLTMDKAINLKLKKDRNESFLGN